MKNSIRIEIPKPCQENYGSFTPTSNGGFCSSCKKEVVDFTLWSDERIKTYFKNLTGDTCGHFRQDQLKVYSYGNPNRTAMGWISFLFAGMLLLLTSRQLSAQATPKQTAEQFEGEEKGENVNKARATVTVIGTVTSREDGQVMSGVKVRLKGTSTETVTDGEGKFKIALPNRDSSQLITFSFNGFKTVEYIHNTSRPGHEIAVDMTRLSWDNIKHVLGGTIGGVVVSRRCAPIEIDWDILRLLR